MQVDRTMLENLNDDELDELLWLVDAERQRRWKLRRQPHVVEDIRKGLRD